MVEGEEEIAVRGGQGESEMVEKEEIVVGGEIGEVGGDKEVQEVEEVIGVQGVGGAGVMEVRQTSCHCTGECGK